jgi:hypothetical protein
VLTTTDRVEVTCADDNQLCGSRPTCAEKHSDDNRQVRKGKRSDRVEVTCAEDHRPCGGKAVLKNTHWEGGGKEAKRQAKE